MSDFLITVRGAAGNEAVFARVARGPAATGRSIRHAFFELGKDLKAEANREILRRPKSGRVYLVRSRGGRRRRHVASAPGETHANLSGDLRRAVGWKVHGNERLDFGYGVSGGSSNPSPRYDAFVEFGTRKMAPRPSLANAIRTTQNVTEREFEANMNREFEGGT